MMMMHYA
jgi:hypothetical protein